MYVLVDLFVISGFARFRRMIPHTLFLFARCAVCSAFDFSRPPDDSNASCNWSTSPRKRFVLSLSFSSTTSWWVLHPCAANAAPSLLLYSYTRGFPWNVASSERFLPPVVGGLVLCGGAFFVYRCE
jgi:hypothetical protein